MQSRPTTAQGRKKRPLDRVLPKRIDYIPESKLYSQLIEFENKLDSTITKKKLDIQESLAKPMKIKRTLRVFISNSSSDQFVHEANEDSTHKHQINYDGTPSWTLRIEGRLLDPPNTRKSASTPTAKFSSFIKSIYVELERDTAIYPEGNIIEWHKSANGPETDGVEIKRTGDAMINVKILLSLDNAPEKYKVSPDLAKLLDIHTETKPTIIIALWQYIKANKLQDQMDKRMITCDEALARIFGTQRLLFPQVPELLNNYLLPADPIILDYTIQIDKEFSIGQFAYDIEVEINDPLRNKMQSIVGGSTNLNKEISVVDEKISAIIQSIHRSKVKRDFLLAFSLDPVNFLKKYISSQANDMEVIMSDIKINKDEVRKSEYYKGDWVEQGILYYLHSR